MEDTSASRRAVSLRARTRSQRRLISSAIEELALQRAGRDSFGRVVRVVHATAPTVLAADAAGEVAKRQLMRRCRAQLDALDAVGHRVAA